DWSSDVCSSDLSIKFDLGLLVYRPVRDEDSGRSLILGYVVRRRRGHLDEFKQLRQMRLRLVLREPAAGIALQLEEEQLALRIAGDHVLAEFQRAVPRIVQHRPAVRHECLNESGLILPLRLTIQPGFY